MTPPSDAAGADDPSEATPHVTPPEDTCDDPSTEKLIEKQIENTADVKTAKRETKSLEWGPGRREYAAKMHELRQKNAGRAAGETPRDLPLSTRDALADFGMQLMKTGGIDATKRDPTESEAS